MAKKTFLLRLPEKLHEWLTGYDKVKSGETTIHQFIIDAITEKRYREENKNPYSEGWRDGYEARDKEGES